MINSPLLPHRPHQWVKSLLAAGALVATALCGSIPLAYAQDDEHNWFQIEVILFANVAEQWRESEHWRDKFELIYPDNLVILKPYREYEFEEFDTDFDSLRRKMPGELEPIDSDFSALRREYISPEQREQLEQLELELELERELEQQEAATFTRFDQVFADPLSNAVTPVAEQPAKLDRLEKPMDLDRDPFILLPKKHLNMRQSARRIDRASDLRLLAHFAWRQPLDEKNGAVPVLVQAGDQFDLDFELEGTLTASENRYLHVDSTLYFSRFERTPIADSTDWSSFYETPASPAGDAQSSFNTEFNAANLSIFDQHASDDFQRILTATASDSRRLKSAELHYIDHPLFGILVKMTPHELPDPVMEMRDFDIEALPKKKPLPVAELAPLTPGPTAVEGVAEPLSPATN